MDILFISYFVVLKADDLLCSQRKENDLVKKKFFTLYFQLREICAVLILVINIGYFLCGEK
ncbi:hypothetical protein AM305_07343 [Actinobacillus minor NM305]|uniref:Uncharacterized protein n=1 Tax=Actinobacillus minor NM305 TaxID=637911 RepID=C5S0P3_9PAST|nr:hypothetical protein AM305_07343 [Actinobacillus minor NM305]